MTALPHRHSSRHARVLPVPQPQLRLVWSSPTINRIPKSVYWQRRFVAFLLLVFLVAGSWALLQAGVNWSSQTPATPPMTPIAAETYVVQPGDTLWSIATKGNPAGTDVRPIVAKMSKARGGSALQSGEVITLG